MVISAPEEACLRKVPETEDGAHKDATLPSYVFPMYVFSNSCVRILLLIFITLHNIRDLQANMKG